MRKLTLVLLLVSALVPSTLASAEQIQVGYSGSNYGMYQTGHGGEFTLNVFTSGLSTSGYLFGAGDTGTRDIGVTGTFQSFCLEETEYIYAYPSSPYVVVNSMAVSGGVGLAGDPLSFGTTYLYSQFATGALAYNYGAAGRSTSAALLQQAFWWLENEGPSFDSTNPYMALAVTTFGSQANAKADAAAGAYGVYALNLWGDAEHTIHIQDQLYYASVPDGGATMTLLGGALLGLGALRRKLRA
jgi:hypothetical protein